MSETITKYCLLDFLNEYRAELELLETTNGDKSKINTLKHKLNYFYHILEISNFLQPDELASFGNITLLRDDDM